MDPLLSSRFFKNVDLSSMKLNTDNNLRFLINQKAQDSKEKFAVVQDWGAITSAKDHLFSLLDQVTECSQRSFAFPIASVPTPPPTTPPTTPPTPTPFELAEQKAQAAKTALEAATTIEAFKVGWQNLQAAVQEMETTATTDQDRTKLTAWQTAIAGQQTTISKIEQLDSILSTFSQFIAFLDTTTDIDKAYMYRGIVSKGLEEMAKLVKELTDANVSYPVIQDVENKINQKSKELSAKGDAVQQAYELGKIATALVEDAKNNNSVANIAAAKKQIADNQTAVQALLTQYPNAQLIQQAQRAIAQAEKDIDVVTPSEGFTTPLGTPGGGATVGSSRSNSNLRRVGFLLDNVDNETLGIILQGFRGMLDKFYDQNASMRFELNGIEQQNNLEDTIELDLQEELQQVEASLFGEQEAPISMSDALAAISAASVKMGGGAAIQPAQVSDDVKQLYNAASPSGGKKGKEIVAGYDAWSRLNETFASNNEQVREILNQTTRPALSREISYIGIPSMTDDRNMRAAHTIARNSRSLGEVYQRVRVLDRGLTLIQQNPQSDLSEVKKQLIDEITSAPRFGYPYTQLPSALAGKFIADLEKEFEEESLRLSKQKAAQFEVKPMYIQQVLVNIASLFSVYLNG